MMWGASTDEICNFQESKILCCRGDCFYVALAQLFSSFGSLPDGTLKMQEAMINPPFLLFGSWLDVAIFKKTRTMFIPFLLIKTDI